MLDPVLQSLRDVAGVQGAMIVDPTGGVVAYRAHTIYDLGVLQQVARSVNSVADAIQLIQDDWDGLTSHFGDGKLILRSLRVGAGRPRRYVLTVIADATLNVAFLGVALRVAATKLIAELDAMPAGGPSVPVPPAPPSAGVPSSAPIPVPVMPNAGSAPAQITGRLAVTEPSRSDVARAGLSWSSVQSGSSGSAVGSASMAGSDVSVADAASANYLSACTKALALALGPMAKVFVKESVRRLCGDRPFARSDGNALVAALSQAIDDADDRAAFLRAASRL